MAYFTSHLPGDPTSLLIEQWRDTSLATGWRHPSDWDGPGVNAMVLSVLGDASTGDSAASLLGADRAAKGVGLAEGLADLAVLFQLVSASAPPFDVTRSFAQNWAEDMLEALLDRGAVDALSGLVTRDYLVPRLREIYAEASMRSARVDDERCLIVVSAGEDNWSGWQRLLYTGTVGRVIGSVLDRGETNCLLPSGSVVSIASRGPTLGENVVRLARGLAIARVTSHDMPLVRVEPLPPTLVAAETLVRGL